MNGYDISNNQGDINNILVPGDFVIIKASEGVGYTDPDCDANYQQAKAAGKERGLYHFARPDGNSPEDEAKWFASQVRGYIGEAVFVLDLEVQPISPDWAKRFMDTFFNITGVRCWLYMSQSAFNTGDWSAVWPNYAAWVACYGMNNQQNGYGNPNAPVTINGDWTIVAIQYTSKGILPGWGGDLDLNIAYLDRAGWAKYANPNQPAPAPTPAPTPVPIVPPVVQEPTPVPVTPVSDTPAPVVTPIPIEHIPTPSQDIPVSNPPVVVTPKHHSLLAEVFIALGNLFRSMFSRKK